MSKAAHPAHYDDPSCCKPFMRLTPSGRVQRWHAFGCKVSPNEFIEPKRHTPQPVVLHDFNTCRVPNCDRCAYIEAHLDGDDDVRNGQRP